MATQTDIRRPGRPTGAQGEVKQALIAAARRLFAAQGYGVPLRAVAEDAGVNPAMIHYYFGDKQGLYEAVLQETVGPFLTRLREVATQPSPGQGEIRVFLEAYIGMLASNPWIPQLIIREVLADHGRFRDRFIRQFASQGRALLVELIGREQRTGHLRADLDPELAGLSLMSLALFPFLALPVARAVFAFDTQPGFIERFIGHTESLFFQGARAGDSP